MQPDLLQATDPDCDRVGIAVKNEGEYVLSHVVYGLGTQLDGPLEQICTI